MAGPLLETKFHVPAPVGGLVARQRLRERLRHGARGILTLVSAPAGFGKSTLIAELAKGSARPASRVAWLSLDAGDNEPAAFWAYVIGALERTIPGVGAGARAALDAGVGSVDMAVTALLNGLAATDADVTLVLDDLHVIEAAAIYQQLGVFVERAPANAHIVIGTRADPPMPLARLRARGALTEIRAADLRFTDDEAAEYLNATMSLGLGAADMAALEARTEGWIAALQLAALSLRGRDDPHEFIAAFSGDDRYVVDYLVEEVLRRQPPEVREFLLHTSILARLNGPLVDAVTGRADGRATLEALDRGNLFLIALDDHRRWYRYHHLFGGVLQAYLAAEHPDELPTLHRRASEWFEGQGDLDEAIGHAFEGGDAERAADLLEVAAPTMGRFRREPAMCRLIDRLPAAVIARRPVLLVEYAGALLSIHEFDRVEGLLDAAERLIGSGRTPTAPANIVVVDETGFERLPAMLVLYRAALAKLHGDTQAHLAHARRVLELVTDDDHLSRGGAEAFLGLAAWEVGDLEEAYRWYAQGMASLERGGRIADVVGGAITSADIRIAQGRLGDALRLFEMGLELGTRDPGSLLRGVTDMHDGIAWIRYQRNDLDGAEAALAASARFGDELGFPRHPYRVRLVEARLRQASGDVDGAVAALDDAERRYVADFSPDVRPIAAQRAAVQLAHGRLAAAQGWAAATGLSLEDPVTYVHELALLTLARIEIAAARERRDDRGDRGDGRAAAGDRRGDARANGLAPALRLLDRLLAAAEAGARDGSVLEILVVQALARHAAGDTDGALQSLDRAIGIAEPEGNVRVFLDEGPAMTSLLKIAARAATGAATRTARSARSSAFLTELLGAATSTRTRPPSGPPATTPGMRAGSLIEPLSERELEVLRLLRSELTGPEMANELVVSLNTLRTHTKNIYAKLGVTSRLAALRRADELHLL